MLNYINANVRHIIRPSYLMLFLLPFTFLVSTFLHAQTEIFFDSFESGAFDLNYWEPVPGPNNGIVEVVLDATAPDDFFTVRMGKSSDGDLNTNELRLYLNLAGYSQVALEFWIKDFYDETGPFDGIYFSDDSAQTATKVFQLDPGGWRDNAWGKLPPLDVDGLAADNGLLLNERFVIIFKQMGTGDFNTLYDEDGILLDAVRVYDPEINYSALPYANSFESGSLDNTLSWAFPAYPAPGTTVPDYIRPGGLVRAFEDATAPDGNWAVQMSRRSDGNTTTNAIDLHLDLSGVADVDLQYWIRDFYNEDHEEDGIFFSDDGGNSFKKVFDFLPTTWNDNFWGKLPPLDVDRRAFREGLALTSNFVIRFQQRGIGDLNTLYDEDGLILDLIQVQDPEILYVPVLPAQPFTDGFETGQFGKMWRWANPFFPDTTARDGLLRPGGFVGIQQVNPHSEFFHATMGRRNDGVSTTNALDLHLDLAGTQGAKLHFWIADYYDETGPSDGIWLSVDGGSTFEKIFQLDPSVWANNEYQEITVGISDSAAVHGMVLSDSCVIRFQQNGLGDFNTLYDEDGFRIDDVSVMVDSRTGIEQIPGSQIAGHFELSQNYPNPFNPSTTIQYRLANSARVELRIYDQLGQLVQTLVSAEQPAGTYEVQWDGKNQAGTRVASGIYFYHITTGSWQETRKMLLIQ
ncbi:MAG: T9SS type A sorting domain-containing protein [Calditrichaeota bacterium]|nr:T9SS type A sorting domain-containing protein [Calditrichota bacterium]